MPPSHSHTCPRLSALSRFPPPCAIRLLYKSFAPTSDPVVGAAQKAAKNERVEKKRKRKEDKSKRKRAAS